MRKFGLEMHVGRGETASKTEAAFSHMRKFGLEMHVGRGETASKTEAAFCPKPRKPYEAEITERV